MSSFLDLESEMYQLSHLLIEQRNTLSTLREESLLDEQRNQIAVPCITDETCKRETIFFRAQF